MNIIKYLFEIEKKPRKGLLAVEWVIMSYLLLTALMVLFSISNKYFIIFNFQFSIFNYNQPLSLYHFMDRLTPSSSLTVG